jgi:hypothetical protein
VTTYCLGFLLSGELPRACAAAAPEATLTASLYASSCTPCTDLPEHSPPELDASFLNCSSHSMAAGVEHATEGPPGADALVSRPSPCAQPPRTHPAR